MEWHGYSGYGQRPASAQVGEEHLAPPESLAELLPANDGPTRPKAPAWAVERAVPILNGLRTGQPPALAERHAHRLLFARWLYQHTRIWRDDE